MAKITLNINGNIDDARRKIAIVKNDLKSIEQFKIKVSVDASGVQALDKSALKSVESFAKLTNAQARLKESENALAIQSEKTRQAEIKLEAQRERTRRSMQSQREETDRLNQSSESLLDNIQKNASWYLISGAVSAAVRSLRDAISTMKAVDDELVTVRKVTGMAGDELKALEEQAYQTASAYGQSAQDYLAFVSGFARAGYKEQSAALAELATKTQIVGDTSAETAQQFLLSVDAAYKYKGSITELSKVLDGANELDNKYATSIEKIAEGMGIVAPVAAQMHVTVGELAAAIGTITAVTQRTGAEASRALRAIFLNIVGDTATEIDEGVTWTTGEIAGLRDVIKTYAPEAYKAAEATGSIIDPMEAIGGLARSMKDGLLSEQELMETVSDIGGKLRTSQLLALIENWDMYQSMLADYGNALGSADREVENALDSWTRKSQILANTWAQFVSHLIDTNAIKVVLDGLTLTIEILDSEFTKFAVTVGGAASATALFGKMLTGLKGTQAIQFIMDYVAAIKAATLGSEAAASALTFMNSAILKSPVFLVAVGAAALYSIVKVYDALNVTFEERLALLDEASRRYDEEAGALDALNGKLAENQKLLEAANAEGASKEYTNRLIAENEELRRQITLQEERARKAKEAEGREAAALLSDKNQRITSTVIRGHDEAVEMAEYVDVVSYAEHLLEVSEAEGKVNDELLGLISTLTETKDKLDPASEAYGVYAKRINGVVDATAELTRQQNADTNLSGIGAAIREISDALDRGLGPTESYVQSLSGIISRYGSYYDSLNATKEAGGKLLEQELEFIRLYESMTSELNRLTRATNDQADAAATAQDAADELKTQISAASAALKDFVEYGGLGTDSMKGLTEAMGDSLDALFDETGALTGTGAAAFETASEFEHAKDAAEYLQAAAQAANYQNLIAQIQAAGTAAAISTQQISLMLQAAGMNAGIAAVEAKDIELDAIYNRTSVKEEFLKFLSSQSESLNRKTEEIARSAPKGGSPGGGSSSGKSSGKEKDEELEARKAEVALEKQRLSFLEASGASDGERIAKMQDIQTALHAQAEYLRSIGASEEDVKALSTEWWTIQEKIRGAYEEQYKNAVSFGEKELSYLEAAGASDGERIAKLRDIQTALQAQEAYLRSIGAEAEDILDVATKRKKIEKDIADIYEEQEKAAKQAFYDYAEAQKKALEKARDAALAPLQAQLDALNAQRDAVEEQRREQERLLAVEEARRALENAQNQRNVRQFNADTQQWEWVADSRTVEDAKKAVVDAEKALADYHAEQLYRAQKKAVEDQIAATQEAFEAQRDAWIEAAELVRNGAVSVQEAMIYAAQAVQSAASQISSMAFTASGFSSGSSTNARGSSGGGSSGGGSSRGSGGSSYSWDMPDMSRNEALAGKTVYSNGMNVTYDENGYATRASNPDHELYEGTTKSAHAQDKDAALRGESWTPDYTGLVDWNDGSPDYSKKYDAGGVLRGIGGIKATAEDELILPPDLTKAVLSPTLTQDVASRLQTLGVLTGVRPPAPGASTPENNVNRIGTQNIGDTYQVYVNGMQVPNVTQGTTIGELARMARLVLPLHRS